MPIISALVDGRASVDGRDYSTSATVAQIFLDYLFGTGVVLGDSQCRFFVLFNIQHKKIGAVKFRGKRAEVLMSFHVCERKVLGGAADLSCISKNIYLFKAERDPYVLLKVGCGAFVRSTSDDWEMIGFDKNAAVIH